MNKAREKFNRLVEWFKKWWRRVLRIFVTLAVAISAVLVALYYCNYTSEDKTTILQYLAVSIAVVTVIYLAWQRWENEEYFEWWLAIVIITAIVVFGAWDAYYCNCFVGDGKPVTLNYLLGSLGAVVSMYLFLRRVRNQEEQIKIEAFTTAVGLLGSDETSARTGAIYSLYQQAVEHKKYRNQIVQILCSHIRSKTQEPKYQKDHRKRPSNEIQTTIDLLFRETENKGLYSQFRKELPNANLSYAYCVGANFEKASCQEANFEKASCQGANFLRAHCRGANFEKASCQGARFRRAHCQGADFREGYCQGANFFAAHCQEANFERSHCEGANFWSAHCQGTGFGEAHCEGAKFLRAHCQGTDFDEAHCQGAGFMRANCQGAKFYGTNFQGAYSFYVLQSLKSRIGKKAKLELVLEGALLQQSINEIEKAKPYCSLDWYAKMQEIIEDNEGKGEKYGPPVEININLKELKDSKKLQEIIEELEGIEESTKKGEPYLPADDIPHDNKTQADTNKE